MSLPDPGDELHHDLPDGGRLVMMHDGVYIHDVHDKEVVSWTIDEWRHDIDAVTATLNAVSLALKHGADAVEARFHA